MSPVLIHQTARQFKCYKEKNIDSLFNVSQDLQTPKNVKTYFLVVRKRKVRSGLLTELVYIDVTTEVTGTLIFSL